MSGIDRDTSRNQDNSDFDARFSRRSFLKALAGAGATLAGIGNLPQPDNASAQPLKNENPHNCPPSSDWNEDRGACITAEGIEVPPMAPSNPQSSQEDPNLINQNVNTSEPAPTEIEAIEANKLFFKNTGTPEEGKKWTNEYRDREVKGLNLLVQSNLGPIRDRTYRVIDGLVYGHLQQYGGKEDQWIDGIYAPESKKPAPIARSLSPYNIDVSYRQQQNGSYLYYPTIEILESELKMPDENPDMGVGFFNRYEEISRAYLWRELLTRVRHNNPSGASSEAMGRLAQSAQGFNHEQMLDFCQGVAGSYLTAQALAEIGFYLANPNIVNQLQSMGINGLNAGRLYDIQGIYNEAINSPNPSTRMILGTAKLRNANISENDLKFGSIPIPR